MLIDSDLNRLATKAYIITPHGTHNSLAKHFDDTANIEVACGRLLETAHRVRKWDTPEDSITKTASDALLDAVKASNKASLEHVVFTRLQGLVRLSDGVWDWRIIQVSLMLLGGIPLFMLSYGCDEDDEETLERSQGDDVVAVAVYKEIINLPMIDVGLVPFTWT
ncbi:hypothetical protein P280DRAFT_475121 [Massarina eburnea CBS 473.64]|uniref:Uncharacterized protein n=1 Tax=Massarina eburnea CBS 473.64 TaxID=1395130 RepID=A0A6A6SEJ4_9PLEO|nr:hypothetical protein P280DRAFT_475121 [Massarina eburnea CBS 473.64]